MAKGKKSGAFLNQKKKAGSADFSNPKAKVGRKVKRRVGETDASFQTRQLSIGEQSIARQKKDARWMEMVYEYAEYLGMDVSEDAELLWIAEQALRAPVPQSSTMGGPSSWRTSTHDELPPHRAVRSTSSLVFRVRCARSTLTEAPRAVRSRSSLRLESPNPRSKTTIRARRRVSRRSTSTSRSSSTVTR